MDLRKTEVIISSNGKHIVRYVVGLGEYLIGRDKICEIKVEAEAVSRRHAKLIVGENEWAIMDIGSTYGTYIDGKPVTTSTRVVPSQKVKIGTVMLELHRPQLDPAEDSHDQWRYEVERYLPARVIREQKYEIGEIIAQGGMGKILIARETGIRRTVAMKVLRGHDSTDHLLRFIEEAQVTGQLDHPGIVPVYDLGVDTEHQPFYTMKYVRGVTLREILGKLGEHDAETITKYPLASLLIILQKVCDAIAFAHSKNVIHRDLKPDNIMIGHFGEVLVMDWGLAKLLQNAEASSPVDSEPNVTNTSVIVSARHDEGEGGRTLSGTVMGTPNYMAPEQAEGAVEKIDARTDVFALGGILYHMLALQMPFSGKTLNEVLDKVMRCEITPAPDVTQPHLPDGRIPQPLINIVMKAMAKQQEDRYQSVPDLQKDITAYQNGLTAFSERASQRRQFMLFFKMNKGPVLGLLLGLLLTLGVLAVYVATVVYERNQAEAVLSDLRRTAPNLQDIATADQFWRAHNLLPDQPTK
jgi:serine/threonine protein kinase